jgi:cell division protein FtsB
MDSYQKKIDKLQIQNIVLEAEIKKLKETIITLQLKVNKLTLNDYGCSEDSE